MSSKVTVSGRLTRDPELRFTNGGKAVAQFSVVTARKYKNPSGQWEEADTSFWDITAFGDMAENICETVSKGSPVIVTGAMRQETWQDKEGKDRRAWRVLADDVAVSIRWQKLDVRTTEDRISGGGSSADYQEPPF